MNTETKDKIIEKGGNKSIRLKVGGRLRIGGAWRWGGTRGPTDQFALGSYGESNSVSTPCFPEKYLIRFNLFYLFVILG